MLNRLRHLTQAIQFILLICKYLYITIVYRYFTCSFYWLNQTFYMVR